MAGKVTEGIGRVGGGDLLIVPWNGAANRPVEIMLRSTHQTIAHPYGSWGSGNGLVLPQGSDHGGRSDPASQGRDGRIGRCCRGSRWVSGLVDL